MKILLIVFLGCSAFVAAQGPKADPVKGKKAFDRAQLLVEKNQPEEAFKVFTEALDADANLAAAWRERGRIRWQLG
jgi:hypothetical protein